jgi:hypothetical protein
MARRGFAGEPASDPAERTRTQFLLEVVEGQRSPVLLLGLAVVSGFWLLSLDSHLTFIADDWDFLVRRQGSSLGVVLEPFNGNTAIGPALFFKLWLALFGLGSATPYYVAAIALYLASCILVFVYVRRRAGEALALIAAVAILFLGAAFEVLLWISPINFVGSMVAGLGMLLALDRDDQRGDRIATGLLVVSIAFSSLGLAFGVGAAVDLILSRRPAGRRIYLVLLPACLYALWWVGWGHNGQSYVSLQNIEHLPVFLFDSGGAAFTSMFGLASNDGSEPGQPHLIWGKLMLIAFVMLCAWRIVRAGGISRDLGIVLTITLAFWILTGVNRSPERFPTSSRYQYTSVILVLLVAAELFRGARIPRPAIAGVAVACGLASIGGISLVNREYDERWHPSSDSLRYALAAVQIGGRSVNPQFPIVFSSTNQVPAHVYLSAVTAHGSPAFTPAELAAAPESDREWADLTLAQALGLALRAPAPGQQAVRCEPLQPSGAGDTGVTLLYGSFTLENETSQAVDLLLGRFSEGLPVSLGPLPAGVTTSLTIPVDNSNRPWNLGLTGGGRVRLCTTTAGS